VITPAGSGWGVHIEDVYVYAVTPGSSSLSLSLSHSQFLFCIPILSRNELTIEIDQFSLFFDIVNIDSTILDFKCFQQIVNWIGKACRFVVRYKASLNGFSSKLFHALCDDKGNPFLLLPLLESNLI
jgi:hypothetical protein